MTFISAGFIVFLLAALVIYFVLPVKFRWAVLLAASLLFYALAGPVFLVQILVATAVTFGVGLAIEAEQEKPRKQAVLWVAITLLVLNLLAFKYLSFFNESLRSLFGWFGGHYPIPGFELILPLGLSFYTFQLISYVVDVYRGEKAETRLGIFTLYVMFFPKMVSGPIERGRNLLPQLHLPHRFDSALIIAGLQLAAWGAFKKIVVADRIAPFVNACFDDPTKHQGMEMSIAVVLYAFQLYCDFSGYTDMALGVALMFGIKLSENFNRPYFSTSIQDFWKRWHISLTSWLTDYVYTPLTRGGWIKMKWYNLMLLSLFITFVVSGLWHGAQWTFVAWGALHGAYIVVSHLLTKPYNKLARDVGLVKRKQLHKALKIGVTFFLVCAAYILFRANSLSDAAYIVAHLHTGWGDPLGQINAVIGGAPAEFTLALIGIVIVMAPEFWQKPIVLRERLNAAPIWARWGCYYAMATALILFGAYWGNNQQFIYFQF